MNWAIIKCSRHSVSEVNDGITAQKRTTLCECSMVRVCKLNSLVCKCRHCSVVLQFTNSLLPWTPYLLLHHRSQKVGGNAPPFLKSSGAFVHPAPYFWKVGGVLPPDPFSNATLCQCFSLILASFAINSGQYVSHYEGWSLRLSGGISIWRIIHLTWWL